MWGSWQAWPQACYVYLLQQQGEDHSLVHARHAGDGPVVYLWCGHTFSSICSTDLHLPVLARSYADASGLLELRQLRCRQLLAVHEYAGCTTCLSIACEKDRAQHKERSGESEVHTHVWREARVGKGSSADASIREFVLRLLEYSHSKFELGHQSTFLSKVRRLDLTPLGFLRKPG